MGDIGHVMGDISPMVDYVTTLTVWWARHRSCNGCHISNVMGSVGICYFVPAT